MKVHAKAFSSSLAAGWLEILRRRPSASAGSVVANGPGIALRTMEGMCPAAADSLSQDVQSSANVVVDEALRSSQTIRSADGTQSGVRAVISPPAER